MPEKNRNIDSAFVFCCWLLGGILTVIACVLILTYLLQESDPLVKAELFYFTIISLIYCAVAAAFMWLHWQYGEQRFFKKWLLPIGGLVSVLYLALAIPFSGGLYFSPLTYSFIYLPAVVTWYLNFAPSNASWLRRPEFRQSLIFCLICIGVYMILLLTTKNIAETAVGRFMLDGGIYSLSYKGLKAAVVFIELFATLLFSAVGHHEKDLADESSEESLRLLK